MHVRVKIFLKHNNHMNILIEQYESILSREFVDCFYIRRQGVLLYLY